MGNEHDATRDFDMIEGFLSGPIPGTRDRLRFFLAGRQRYGADRALEFDDDTFDPSRPSKSVSPPVRLDLIEGWRALGYHEQRDMYSKLSYHVNPAAKLSLSWLAYERERQSFDFRWLLAGVEPLSHVTTGQDSAFYVSRPTTLSYDDLVQSSVRLDRSTWILRWDHTLGRSAYNVTLGHLRQRRTTCNFVSGVCLEHRFQGPAGGLDGFVTPIGRPLAYSQTPTAGTDVLWGGERLTTNTARIDFVWQASDHHNLSAGIFAQSHDVAYDEWEQFQINTDSTFRQTFGAAPWDAAIYVQDLVEYDFLTVKLGARFDYGKATGRFFADPLDPTNSTTAFDVCRNPTEWQHVRVREWDPVHETVREETLSADPSWTLQDCAGRVRAEASRIATADDFADSEPRIRFSPRLGISFPVTESSNLFFNFGNFSQNPILIHTYRNTGIGTAREGTIHGPALLEHVQSNVPQTRLGNPHLRSERTTLYELGFNQLLADTYALQAVVFAKDQTGLAGTAVVGAVPYLIHDPGVTYGTSSPAYTVVVNRDFATVRGVDVQLRRRLEDHWGFQLNYGYASCRANAVEPDRESESRVVENDPEIRQEIPCDVDRRHQFSGVLAAFFDDDAPRWAPWLRQSNLSIVAKAASGLPYTRSTTPNGLGELGQLGRNAAHAPATWQIDLQIRKDWSWRAVRYGLFVEVLNLTDRTNCVQVFDSSGDCRGGADDLDRQAFAEAGDIPSSTALDRPHYVGMRRSITAGLRVRF